MVEEFKDDAEERMQGAVRSLDDDLSGYRTGRASTRLLDRIIVEMYGVKLPLNQMAVVSVPESQQLAIRPYDANSISAIERSIIQSDLGLNPNNDGKIIRLNLPRLTQERRRELSKLIRKRVEEAKVAVRNVRRDVLRDFKDLENEKEITEDEHKRAQEDVQELTDKYVGEIDQLGKAKTSEVMEI